MFYNNDNCSSDLFARSWQDASITQQAQQMHQVRQQYGQRQQSTKTAQHALIATSSINPSRSIQNRVMANPNVNLSNSQSQSQSQTLSVSHVGDGNNHSSAGNNRSGGATLASQSVYQSSLQVQVPRDSTAGLAVDMTKRIV